MEHHEIAIGHGHGPWPLVAGPWSLVINHPSSISDRPSLIIPDPAKLSQTPKNLILQNPTLNLFITRLWCSRFQHGWKLRY